MQRKGTKLHHRRSRSDIKKTFTQRGARHWHSLPEEVVMAPDPPDFNQCLDNTLRQVVCDSCTGHSQELDSTFVCPLQLRIFYESMIPDFSFEYFIFEPKPSF